MAGPFEKAGAKMEAQVAAALDAFAEIVFEESQVLCPVDTGTLKASGKVVMTDAQPAPHGGFMVRNKLGQYAGKADIGNNDIKAIIGYGFGSEINPKTRQPASEYAVPVHEIIEAYHEPPTQAKFLEDPVLANAAAMGQFLAAAMVTDTHRVIASYGPKEAG